MANDKRSIELTARERQAIVGGLKLLQAHAWDDRLHGQRVTSQDIAAMLEIATESYQFDMMNPQEIDVLCHRMRSANIRE